METPDSKKLRHVNTDCSASYSFNNLTESETKIFYIHNSEIQPRIIVIDKKLFSIETDQKNLGDYITKLNGNEVLQYSSIKKVEVDGKEYIAVGLLGGFKIWSHDGVKLLFQATNENFINFKSYSVYAICDRRCVGKNYKKSNYNNSVIFGDSHGTITQCNLKETFVATKLYQNKKDATVTALTTNFSSGVIVSGYDNGQLIVLDGESENDVTELIVFDNEYNLPVISLVTLNKENSFIAGYLNGEIRIFSYSSLQMMFIFQAHSKNITSLSSFESYFTSTGEDGFINVYKFSNNRLEVTKNIGLENKIPVGSVITKIDGKNCLVSCSFDNPILVIFDNVV